MSNEIDLEKRARRIERATLSKVFYQHGAFVTAPRQVRSREPHDAESVYLQTDDQRLFRFFWTDEFHLRHGFGISITEKRTIDRDLGPIEDMTSWPSWRDLVGQRITTSFVHWRDIESALRMNFRIALCIHSDHLSRCDYPESIEIDFESGEKRFFTAASIRENGEIVRFTNHLLVSETPITESP